MKHLGCNKCILIDQEQFVADVITSYLNFEKCKGYIKFEGKLMTENDYLKEYEEYFIVRNTDLNNIETESFKLSNRQKKVRVTVIDPPIYKTDYYTFFKGIEDKGESNKFHKIINNKYHLIYSKE